MTKEMNLIFDLQLFDADPKPEVLFGTGSPDQVTIGLGGDSNTVKSAYKYNGSAWEKLTFKGGETVSGFNAGGGADSITVASGIGGLTIAGGGGHDYITIEGSSRTVGNVYSIASGQGDDSIYGWDAAKDTLQIGSAIKSSVMSPDGNDLTIKFESGSVKLVGIGATNITDKEINILNSSNVMGTTVVPYAMEGTSKADTITNTNLGSPSSTLRSGDSSKALTVSGGAGKDAIINEGSDVYIDGGADNDKITVQGKGTANSSWSGKAENVTINGGEGNDSIYFVGGQETVEHVVSYDSVNGGKDYIVGFSEEDTISLATAIANADADNFLKNNISADNKGNLIINFNDNNQITLKDGVTLLGGKTLHIGGQDLTIRKEWIGTSGSNTLNADTLYNGYSINALGGNDSITISGATVNANGDVGNDVFYLTGGTNTIANNGATEVDVKSAVTVYGGGGNDSINAATDNSGDTLATHVYSFAPGEGKDSILGFNEGDTIQIEDLNATVSGAFENGHYVLTIGNTAGSSGSVVLEGYEGGSKLNLYIKTADGYTTLNSGKFIGDGATAYKKVGDIETTVPSGDSDIEYYRIVKQAQGSGNSDELTIGAEQNDFVVDAGAGNDYVTVEGSSNVSISGGAGNDSIYILKAGTSSNETYSAGLTINGGANNDVIRVETVSAGDANNPTGSDYKAYPKVYEFGASDGNDSIYGFNEYDSIKITGTDVLVGVSVAANGKDAIVAVGKNTSPTKTTATITLIDYASQLSTFDSPINIIDNEGILGVKNLEKIFKGTSGNDDFNTGNVTIGKNTSATINEGFWVSLAAGNDQVVNTVSAVTLDGGSGNDTISNGGNNVYIIGGTGNDNITLTSDAENAVIVAGAGKDSIYGNANGGHIYRFDAGEGTNYIVNFNPNNDTIQAVEGAEISAASVTADGVKLVVSRGNLTATTVYLKGAPIETSDTGTDDLSKYQLLEGNAKILTATVGGSSNFAVVNREIIGTTGKDTINNTIYGSHTDVDGYAINADNGNDIIYNSGSNVTINAGEGNDTIYLMQDTNDVVAKHAEISAGTGNDLIIGNGEGHVYKYTGGKDSIYGFTEGDSLYIGDHTYSTSLTNDGFLIKVDNSNSKTILIKGAVKDDNLVNSTSAGDYDSLEAGTKIWIYGKESNTASADYHQKEVTPSYLGTSAPDTVSIDLTSKNITGIYTIDAAADNDEITVKGDNVSINAGIGDDKVTILGGKNIIVNVGKGNDTVWVTDTLATGHVFEFANYDGNNIIYGLNSNDTIRLTTKKASISNATFQDDSSIEELKAVNNGFVLTLSDNKTQITLLGSETSAGSGSYASLKDKTFFIQYTDENGELKEAEEFKVPNVLKYAGGTPGTIDSDKITAADASDYMVIGNDGANTIQNNGANNLLISLGSGNDSITIASGESNTINPGTGEDYVTLSTSGHIYEYNNNDGNDTIVGWTSDDTLIITGATAISSMMSSLDHGNGIGQDFQLKVGSYKLTFVNTDPDTVIHLFSNSANTITSSNMKDQNDEAIKINGNDYTDITIPKLIIGTSKANTLTNDKDDYAIYADNGNDTITNSGNNVLINAGDGDDTVNITEGDNVTVTAGAGKDIVTLKAGNNASIDGGKGNDTIHINDDIIGVSIDAGEGDDLIIGNNVGNVYFYGAKGGNDTIYGYMEDDRIVLADGLNFTSVSGSEDANASVTDKGVIFTIWDTSTNKSVGKLTVRGQRTGTKGSITEADYESLGGGTKFNFNINGSSVSYELPNKKIITASSSNTITNNASNYLITGTASADTIINTADYVTIDALAGNDTIQTGGLQVSVNAGVGNDTILITENAEDATVDPGSGNDLIIGNGHGGNIYHYSGGKDTIYGYSAEDSLYIDVKGAYFTSSTTADGLLLQVKGSSSSSILLKGARKDTEGDVVSATNYDLIAGDTTISMYLLKDDGTYEESSTTVQKLVLGTSTGETINNLLDGYTINAYGGDDTITNNANKVLIDAGIGKDQITVSGGAEVTVVAGGDDDFIEIEDTSGTGHIFQFNLGDGVNTIKGFGENDSIHLTNKNASIKSVDFETLGAEGEAVVLTLSDSKTKIYMLSQDDAEGARSTLRNRSFYIKYNTEDPEEYNISNIYTIGSESTISTINASGDDYYKAVITDVVNNTDSKNNITVAGAEVSVYAAKGNDTILVTEDAQSATINAGMGDDQITLNGSGHVIQYVNGDGKDTIWGWNEDNILSIAGSATPSVSVSTAGEYILKIGSGYINFGTVTAETNIQIYKDGVALPVEDYAVPKLVQGTKIGEALASGGAEYRILAEAGDDTITVGVSADNTHNDVSVDAGAGHDTIDVYGGGAYIDGGAGKDSVNIAEGNYVTVNTGNDNDLVTIQSGVVNAVINGGAGNDVIYSNGEGNIINYGKDGGNDSIFGYGSSDSIQLAAGVNVKTSVQGTGEDTVNVSMTEMTPEGFIVYLDNGKQLIFKGARKDGVDATLNTAEAYKDLEGGTLINIYENGGNNLADVVSPYMKFVTTGEHTIDNDEANYSVMGSAKSDTIANKAANVSIQAGAYNDVIINDAESVYIDAGAGNDTIYIGDYTIRSSDGTTQDDIVVPGPDGADYTINGGSSNNTIHAGAGNDTIYGNNNGNLYEFHSKTDGKDVIYNFAGKDIIDLGSYKDYWGTSGHFTGSDEEAASLVTATYEIVNDNPSAKDVVLRIGYGTITLKNIAIDSDIVYRYNYGDDDSEVKYTTLKVSKEYVMNSSHNTVDNDLESNFIISKSSQQDTIINSAAYVTISAGGGDDTIQNSGMEASIIAGLGNDTIVNTVEGARTFINAGAGDDTISNEADNVLIYGGAGNDTVTISDGANVSVDAGEDADLIQIGNIATPSIKAGDGDDVIKVGTYQGASIYGGKGDDVIIRTGSDSDVKQGGNSYIYNEGDGNDIIQWAEGDELKLILSKDSTYTTESAANGFLVKVTTANGTTNTIALTGAITGTQVTLGTEPNTVVSTQYSSGSLTGGIMVDLKISTDNGLTFISDDTLSGYSPNNLFVVNDGINTITIGDATIGTISNTANEDYEILNVGTEAKLIENTADRVTINAGEGNDTIYNDGKEAYIFGGKGADSITIGSEAKDVSINAGANNDTVTLLGSGRSNGIVYIYTAGDGKDTIYNYSNAKDRIFIDGEYTYTLDADNDFVVSVGSGANAGTIKLNGITGKGTGDDDNKVIFVDADGVETEVFVPKIVNIDSTATTTNDSAAGAYAFINTTVTTSNGAPETVVNSAHDVVINTGAGADTIQIAADVENVSVMAGKGNDTIEAYAGHYNGITYVFGAADDANWIYNASENDSIKYTGSTFTQDSVNVTTERYTDTSEEILVLTLGQTKVSMRGYEGGNTLTLIDSANKQHLITVPRLHKGTTGNDTINNELAYYEIQAKGGNDIIENSGNYAIITAESGTNSIRNSGNNVVINGGTGNDSIVNESGNKVSINGGAGNDKISLTSDANGLTVVGGAGNDSITSDNVNGVVYQINSNSGSDVINGFTEKDTIQITDGSHVTAFGPTSYNSKNGYLTLKIGNATVSLKGSGISEGKTVTVLDSTGNAEAGTTILQVQSIASGEVANVTAANYYVMGTSGKDTIVNGANTKVSIVSDADADSIENSGTYASILSGAGADTIVNTSSGTNASILAGADNDNISNAASKVYIAGDAGNDTITSTGDNVTIFGGGGNDYLDASGTSRTNGVVYKFNAAGEGKDTIVNFDIEHDKLWFSGASVQGALPAVSINAGDDFNTFTITAYGNTSIVGTATGSLINNNDEVAIKAGYGAEYQEGSINVIRVLTGNTYSTAGESASNYENHSKVALNVLGGQRVQNDAVGASIGANDNTNNYFKNTAAISAAEPGESQDHVYLIATGGADTIENGELGQTTGQYAIINAGNGLNQITNYADNVSIVAGSNADTITNSGSDVTINAGNGNDYINGGTSSSGVSINAGAGADFITISGGSNGGNTVVLGGGNDVVSVQSASEENHGNVYVFSGFAEGTNQIINFSSNDTIRVNRNRSGFYGTVNRVASGTDKENIRITLQLDGENTTYIDLIGYNTNDNVETSEVDERNDRTIHLQFNDTPITWTVPGGVVTPASSPRIAEEPVAALDDLFADDNYMTNDAQISDITSLTQDNYSAGNVETFDLTNLSQNSYSPTATYGKDDEKK